MKDKTNLFDVKFNQNSWFVKFYKWSTNLYDDETPTTNGCRFFWTSLFSILLLPFTWWNLIINLKLDIYDRPQNLLMKTLAGVGCYIGYFLLMGIGTGFYVGGVNSKGEELDHVINIIDYAELTPLWVFLILPVLGILTIVMLFILMFSIIYVIVQVKEFFNDKIRDIRINKLKKEHSDNIDIELDEKDDKTSFLTNMIKLIINIKNKICPVIEWK